ncbi:outer membrane protein assembly factor BamE [Tsuneonella mangrovi]|uniref:outer membrane protein assembly factor BamE n=1 Tax=Tsuneonella mangrovi TaxID=1982042 RepID=UPI000BA1DB2F|nr:outer membrane protein assembly factor BamE [Tsuneonella mangrovi]
MTAVRTIAAGVAMAAALGLAGCASIKNHRGYIVDQTLTNSIAPGIDNQESVQQTLGDPSFKSEWGQPTWYYVSSLTARKPFVRPKITEESVLAVKFDSAGNVASVDRTGIDKVVYLHPDGDATPTLGRNRGFLEDLFGNIGQVGTGAGAGGGAGGGGGQGPNGS